MTPLNSIPTTKLTRALALCIALAPLSVGCASQKQLEDYQDEVRVLREENTRLKKDNRALRAQNDDLSVALSNANAPRPVSEEPKTYAELDNEGIEYGQRDGNFYVSIPSEITFASGRADLTSKGKDALRNVAKVLLADHPSGRFWIEGHTDNDPIKKSKWASNRELSVMRGMAVLHFLVEDCAIPDAQCVVAGHGEYSPETGNDSKENKARNRRVEIVVQ
jgi:flagellar motor protein MotB